MSETELKKAYDTINYAKPPYPIFVTYMENNKYQVGKAIANWLRDEREKGLATNRTYFK